MAEEAKIIFCMFIVSVFIIGVAQGSKMDHEGPFPYGMGTCPNGCAYDMYSCHWEWFSPSTMGLISSAGERQHNCEPTEEGCGGFWACVCRFDETCFPIPE